MDHQQRRSHDSAFTNAGFVLGTSQFTGGITNPTSVAINPKERVPSATPKEPSMQQQAHPAKLTQNLLIQVVGDETLIYDERRHIAFCLDRLASAIWNNADGSRTIAQIASSSSLQLALPVAEESVRLGLAQFKRDGLLHPTAADMAPIGTLSRRAMVGKVGLGAAMMVPVIASVIAPKAAQAYNGCVNCSSAQRRRNPTQ